MSSTDVGATERAIRRLLPSGVAVAVWSGDDAPVGYPDEEAALERAVPRRVAEFRRGRACARAALERLGVPACAIAVGKEREPIWPAGVVGSITHGGGLVAAVAARRERIAALGLDVEPAGPLPEGTRGLIVHPSEDAGDGLEKVVFSAKESIFKALFPLTGVWLGLLDVIVELDERTGRFRAARAPDAAAETPRLAELEGRWILTDGRVMTAAFAEAPR